MTSSRLTDLPAPPSRGPDSFHALPKLDLHVHLEGCVVPLLGNRQEVLSYQSTPPSTPVRSFDEFAHAYKEILDVLDSPDRYGLAAECVGGALAADNVIYAEMIISAGQIVARGMDLKAVLGEVLTSFARIRADLGVDTRLILDITRHHDPRNAWPVLDAAIAFKDGGVVAVGLGGDERRGLASSFADVFCAAHAEGLFVTIHAGEFGEVGSIRSALECVAQRIGHGVRAVDDYGLLCELAARKVAVELCPTSNWRTGAVNCIEGHPARILHESGVPFVIGSDDPAIFGTTTSREYEIIAGLTGMDGSSLSRAAVPRTFLSEPLQKNLAIRLEKSLMDCSRA